MTLSITRRLDRAEVQFLQKDCLDSLRACSTWSKEEAESRAEGLGSTAVLHSYLCVAGPGAEVWLAHSPDKEFYLFEWGHRHFAVQRPLPQKGKDKDVLDGELDRLQQGGKPLQ